MTDTTHFKSTVTRRALEDQFLFSSKIGASNTQRDMCVFVHPQD